MAKKRIKAQFGEILTKKAAPKKDSVNNELMLRQLFQESRFNPEAVSNKDAKGIAQLRDITVKELKDKHKMNVDPMDPLQSIKAHKTLMTDLYNKPWINKPGTSKEVRDAKTLAAYNMGPTGLINILNAEKAKGVDIYKGTKWLESLPEETRNYIKFITGKDEGFEQKYKGAVKSFKYKNHYPVKKQEGGEVIKDDRGQWAHPGEITEINSPDITMKGVNYPVLGISDLGDTKMMYPDGEYKFKGNKVTEYPMAKKKKIKKAQYGLKNPLGTLDPNVNVFGQQPVNLNWGNTTETGVAPGTYSVEGQASQFASTLGQSPANGISKIGGALNIGQNIMGAIGQIKQEKEQKRQAKQQYKLSELTKQVSELKPERILRKYTRPEDQIVDPNQLSPSYGVGTNYLAAKNGAKLKDYQYGGFLGNAGQMLGSWIGGGKGAGSGAGQLGSTIGSTVGKLVPIPGVDQVLGAVGGFVGGLVGGKNAAQTAAYQKKSEKNNQMAALNQSVGNMQLQNSSFMKHGGDVEGLGGDLQTLWGGNLETISENPYLPDGGETVMFKGQSHDDSDGKGRTGIGISYGNNPVEVEAGEPAMKMEDGGGDKNLVIFGDMKMPSFASSIIGDPKAKGKKFKNYVKDLSEQEAKQNKVSQKGLKLIDDSDSKNKFEKLTANSGEALLKGSDMKMKEIAKKKQLASVIQNAILETADEFNLDSGSLAKGNIKKAKKGMKLPSYQSGGVKTIGLKDIDNLKEEGYENLSPSLLEKITNEASSSVPPKGHPDFNKTFASYRKAYDEGVGPDTFQWRGKWYNLNLAGDKTNQKKDYAQLDYDLSPRELDMSYLKPKVDMNILKEKFGKQPKPEISQDKGKAPKTKGSGNTDWMDVLNAALPYIRPSNDLDRPDLSPEMLAMISNQLDPVQAQLYNPLLEQISDISLQDQMNANQADFNAMQRTVGNNPAALAHLSAQKYKANTGVLGEQFRQNQAQKTGVYNRNRATLNDAQLKNLGILDNQYVRQATAKSRTKDTALAALSSMSDKIAKNKMENRTLDIYENLYNYRFGPNGQAWNLNPFANFNMPQVGENLQNVDENGRSITTTEQTVDKDKFGFPKGSRQRIRQTRRNRNGSIVKALKNF